MQAYFFQPRIRIAVPIITPVIDINKYAMISYLVYLSEGNFDKSCLSLYIGHTFNNDNYRYVGHPVLSTLTLGFDSHF